MSEHVQTSRLSERGFTIADTKAYIKRIEAQLRSDGRMLHSLEFVLIRGLVDIIDEAERTLNFYASMQNYIAHVDQTNGSRRPSRVIDDAGTRARAMLKRLRQELPNERRDRSNRPEDLQS